MITIDGYHPTYHWYSSLDPHQLAKTNINPLVPTMTLTANQITDALVLFAIVQSSWWAFKQVIKQLWTWLIAALENERTRLMRKHYREDHKDPLKYCLHPDCQPLRHL